MAFDRYPPASFTPGPVNGAVRTDDSLPADPVVAVREPSSLLSRRYAVPALLLLVTLGTTTVVGARLARNFAENRPAFDIDRDFAGYLELLRNPSSLVEGLSFSLTLIGILLAHELGHYLACRYYRIDASLPYFLPAPTFIGTFGAFIRIRSPIYLKRVLFDIGVAGPVAGFVFLLPALAIGLAYSKVIPGMALQGDLVFGISPLQRLLQELIFPGTAAADIYMHPVARAAWVGVFATSLNLLPIGQLDGGHILYAVAGNWHKLLSRLFIAVLLPLGAFFWYGWWFWAALLFFFSMRHPVIYDESGMGSGRRKLAWVALVMFVLTFSLTPIRNSAGF